MNFCMPAGFMHESGHFARSADELRGNAEDRRRTDMAIPNTKVHAPLHIGRWTPQVLFSLREGPHRHGELRRRLGGVSQRVLTRTLRRLESSGLINRRVTRSRVLAVEYSLTKLGRTIVAPLRGMCRWARRYGQRVTAQVGLPAAPSPDTGRD